MLLQQLQLSESDSFPAVCDSRNQLNARSLIAEVTRFALRLQVCGIQRLALHADNSLQWVIADLACMQAGIVCVPLPLFFTRQQLLFACNACGLDAVLSADPALFNPHFVVTQHEALDGYALLHNGSSTRRALPAGSGKVTFTSGSTGTPKGVCLSWEQQQLQARALASAAGLQKPRHLCVLPLSTLLENVAGVYAPLFAAGSVHLRSLAELGLQGSRMVAPEKLLRCISEVEPDTLILIPQLLQLLVQAVTSGWKAPALRFIAIGGSRVAPDLIQQARTLGLPVYEGYGLSECVSVVSLNTREHDRTGSAGQVLPHLTVSTDNGEIHVSGNVMLGYLDEPSSWNRRRIATGDLGHIDEQGFLHISGRSKNLLISSYGRNISPEWVESELLATPLFGDAVVFGEAQPYCVALLAPRDPALSDQLIQNAIDATNQRLPDYAQVRRWYRLPQTLAATPQLITDNGRPRRAAIAMHYALQLAGLYPQEQR